MSKSRFSDEFDLFYSSSGDFVFDSVSKDLKDTKLSKLRSLGQQIQTVVAGSFGDWKTSPEIGANITAFMGKPNTAETGEEIRNQVYQSLITQIGLSPQELKVVVLPTGHTTVAILIKVMPMGQREEILMSYTYNARDNKIVARNV